MSIEAIKEALEGVSHAPGPWKAIRMSVYCNDTTGKRVADTRSEHHLWDDSQRQQLAIYIAAVNPPAISDLISEIDRLQRENDELRLLLVPFAEEAENWSDRVPDDHKTLCTEPGSSTAHPGSEAYFTVGDLRRARIALASTGGEHHGN